MKISLIEFSVQNFKAFKDKATFSMVARKNDGHTFESSGENLLKTSFVYGPNASGKTTILDGFSLMRMAILTSANIQEKVELPHTPFLASVDSKNNPTIFELAFSATESNEGAYRYSFSFVKDHIVTERMVKISSSTGSEKNLIDRKEQDIKLDANCFKDAEMLGSKTRKEALFLSVAAQLNDPFAMAIMNALRNMNAISSLNYINYQQFTIKEFKNHAGFKENFLKHLNAADFCISGGHTEEIDMPTIDIMDVPEKFSAIKKMEKTSILSLDHPIYDKNTKTTDTFKLPLDQESMGTQKFVSILGPIIDTLEKGKVLLIDEFDNSLHPLLTKHIVDLFESEETNKHNAQLIVTTHDTSLLGYRDEFIKDQFWFTEKDEHGAAKLFSLAEFDMRNDTEYAKKYLEGRFGALPFIGSVKK
ncbi:AAA family ATPase [Patescibacteria group bacterium]|nr:AAA family ATPase [Patescibacteria group bacterium]